MLLYLPGALFATAGIAAAAIRLLEPADHARRPHPHASVHGGIVLPVGEGHVELVLEPEGRLRLYMLGKDETELRTVPAIELRGEAQRAGSLEIAPLVLRPDDPAAEAGEASVFAGQLPWDVGDAPASLAVTVPVGQRRYRARFDLAARNEETHVENGSEPAAEMPIGAAEEEQKRLYLTPGGGYTAADIQANGRTTAAERYRGQVPRHDPKPKPGDRICPVTRTRANPRFTWTVSGKRYLFCCPPCIDEFVQQARQDPDSLRRPEEYVQQ